MIRIFAVILLISGNALAGVSPSTVYKNNSAAHLFEDERVLESKTILQKEVVNHPVEGELHYNLGLAHEAGKEPDQALQEYASAIKNAPNNKDVQFMALFNSARVYGEKQDIKNALKNYQAALELRPESQETKTNIELLLASGGQGQNKDQKQDKDKKDDKDDKNKKDQPKPKDQPQDNKDKNKPQNKPQPQKFDSKELSDQDVKRILDELKRQEEQIRAKINNQTHKESPVDKDW